jgi:mannose-1-phosphate guanylyltransferase
VLLTVGYLSQSFEQLYGDGSHLGINLTYVHEDEPLDTGGAIKNVEDFLTRGQTFLVLNGDILTDLNLEAMLRFHKENRSVCTISLTPVEDPSAYGVVDLDDTGRITRFTEKPRREEATSNWINAGTYILEPEVLDYIPKGERYSVERAVFPGLLKADEPLYGYRSSNYWIDIGAPGKYLQANRDLLTGRLKSHLEPSGEQLWEGVWAGEGTFVMEGARITGPVVLGKGCEISVGAAITGPTVLGDGCRVGEEAEIEGAVAWDGASFGAKSICRNSIVGTGAKIGVESRMESIAVLGDKAALGEGNYLANGARIWPSATLPDRSISF